MIRVLVVDDEEDIRLIARVVLERAGCAVTEADDGDRALTLLAEQEFDVVLLDLRMPRIDGWQVLERLRADGVLERVRVVVLSAHVESGVERQSLADGAFAYMRKPFDMADLRDIVQAAAGAA